MRDYFNSLDKALQSPQSAEVLSLKRSVSALPATIAGLPKLRSLELTTNEASLAAILDVVAQMPALTSLRIHLGRGAVGPAIGKLATAVALESLVLQDVSSVPDELGLLANVRRLFIWAGKGFSLPEAIAGMRALEVLEVNARNGLATLPDAVTKLRSLRVLRASHTKLATLPDGLCDLPALAELEARGCALKSLPERIGELRSLRALDVGHNELSSLPASFSELALDRVSLEGNSIPEFARHELAVQRPELEELFVGDSTLRALPDALGRYTKLRELRLQTPALERLPDSFVALVALERLALEGAVAFDLAAELARIGSSPSLRSLELVNLGRASLPEGFGALRSVRSLSVDDQVLERLPASIGAMSALEELRLHCARLTTLPPEIASLPALKSFVHQGSIRPTRERGAAVTLAGMPALESMVLNHSDLAVRWSALPSLRELTVAFGPREDLLALLAAAPRIARLTVRDVRIALDELAAKLADHEALHELALEYYSDATLPDALGALASIATLRLPHCPRLTVPDAWPVPASLRFLSMPRQAPETEARLVALLPKARWSKSVASGDLVFVRKGR